MKLTMPEELGGREYTILDFIPRKTRKKVQKFNLLPFIENKEEDIDEELMIQFLDKMDTIILDMVVTPKMTVGKLDELSDAELLILLEEIIKKIRELTPERMLDLKKKVHKS